MMERLGIPHAVYGLCHEKGYPYSICEDFITAETEFVTAWYLMRTKKRENHTSVYQHYVDCCEKNGMMQIRSSAKDIYHQVTLIVGVPRQCAKPKASNKKYMPLLNPPPYAFVNDCMPVTLQITCMITKINQYGIIK